MCGSDKSIGVGFQNSEWLLHFNSTASGICERKGNKTDKIKQLMKEIYIKMVHNHYKKKNEKKKKKPRSFKLPKFTVVLKVITLH